MTEWPRAPKGAIRLRFVGPLAVFVQKDGGKFLAIQAGVTMEFDTLEDVKDYVRKVSAAPQPAVLLNPWNGVMINGTAQFDLSEGEILFRDPQGIPWSIPNRNGKLHIFPPEAVIHLHPLLREVQEAEARLNALRMRWDQELSLLTPLRTEGVSDGSDSST